MLTSLNSLGPNNKLHTFTLVSTIEFDDPHKKVGFGKQYFVEADVEMDEQE